MVSTIPFSSLTILQLMSRKLRPKLILINYPGESVVLANWSRYNNAQCAFDLAVLRSIETLVQNLTAAITT